MALKQIARRHRYVMVDEFQDLNAPQRDLVLLFRSINANVMVLGDDRQGIFRFRGARQDNFARFRKSFSGCPVFELTHSFRGTQQLVALANANAAHMVGTGTKPMTAGRDGPKPAYFRAKTQPKQRRIVLEVLQRRHDKGIPWSKMAVLARHRYPLNALARELAAADITYNMPHRVPEDDEHRRTFEALVALAVEPSSPTRWGAVLESSFGLTRREAERAAQQAARQRLDVKALPEAVRSDVKELQKALARLSGARDPDKAAHVLLHFLAPLVRKTYADFHNRLYELREVRGKALSFQKVADYVEALPGLWPVPQEGVTLTTIHSAKGLEWRVVVVVDLVDGGLPTHHAFRKDGSPKKAAISEERRIFRVAITRSRKWLYLVSAPVRDNRHKQPTVYSEPSRFLRELEDFQSITRRLKAVR